MAIEKAQAEPLEKLRQRRSSKWTTYPPDVLPLWVAETDYPLAPAIASALHAAVDRNDTGYVGRTTDVADAFAGFTARHWGWQVNPRRTLTTTDVSVVIVESLRALIEPGDGVIITPPVYPPFFDLIPEAGGKVVEVPLVDSGTRWSLDLEGIERAIAWGAKGVLLCNPHNPLGLVHSREQLTALAEIVERYGAFVVSDEIHAPLVHGDAVFTPYLSVPDAAEHAIAAHSASKAFNLAGLKCALFVTEGDRMTAVVRGLWGEVRSRTGHFGRLATAAGYADGDDYLAGVVAAIEDNRLLLTTLLEEHLPLAKYRQPKASYLAWVDLGAYEEQLTDDPAKVILSKARIALSAGGGFGAQGRGHVRINLACAPEVLTEAIQRVAALV
ncbi:aminotransferase class I/II-fold pyridoxal phosphate-dependent enzyme [Gryllotalpicola sp.]|uniref:MalY/PatB family protein n=1 Tax=Gryllotalpicola sp. TaxID=1932787 RepID=UPI0026046F2E|nr:aminotransferase class I/II-fold pyridoxal phosphate-dependent enzyme [Gryllotalpicola sp.]